jgi:hypothetical protein
MLVMAIYKDTLRTDPTRVRDGRVAVDLGASAD